MVLGPRNCIGQKFAMYEMKCCLAKVLLNYEFMEDPTYSGPSLVAELILKPENGVFVRLERRKRTFTVSFCVITDLFFVSSIIHNNG